MNGKFLLITVLSFATLCLAVPSTQNKWSAKENNAYPVAKRSSNEIENILSRWCQSSQMSSTILTESFKQLTASLKDVSSRQLDQLTDDIIVREHFCKEHSNQNNLEAVDNNNEDLIKDVYLDALVACESSAATEQLVRAIDTGKVDKIRANYYLTLLAVSYDGESSSSSSSSQLNTESDIAQKLAQSLLNKQQKQQSGDALVEAIERQKMFAATSVWSKKIQQHQQQQSELTSEMKNKIEQLVEAIVQRYIKAVPVGQANSMTTITYKQIADRDAALKALANIPCFALPQKTVQLLLELALNKNELVSVRQSAIESLRYCSQQQDQQYKIHLQLKQLALYSQEQPIEVRIAAYRIVVPSIKKLTNRLNVVDELVTYINEETKETKENKDVQFVTYVVSHLNNLLKNSDKKYYEILKKEKPQQLAQIKVASKRMQKYEDLRKYSRNFQMEQSFAKLDSGLIFDADIIYERSQYLPKAMRLNISMPVLGKTVELVEVSVRQNNMQGELLSILKPLQSTKINMESIEKVVSGIKKAANEQQQTQSQQQKPELDLSIKMDGCTVMYVSLNDFKQEQQHQMKHRLTRSADYSSGSSSIIEDLLKQLKKSLVFNRGVHFHLNKRLGGVIDLQTVLTGNVRAESKVRSLGNEVYELVAELQPRFAFESVFGLSKFTETSSKKLLQRISTESSIGLRMKYKQDELIDLFLELPMEEMELFKVETQLVEQVGISSTGLPVYKYSVELDTDHYDTAGYSTTQYNDNKNQDQSNIDSSSQWQLKSQQERDQLIRFYGEDIEGYYGETMKNIRERRNLDKQSEYRQRYEIPERFTQFIGLDGRVEFAASPKDLSAIMRVVIKKIDPNMQGLRMLMQTEKLSPSSKAYTIAFSTPRDVATKGTQQQQDRLVQLRLVKDFKSEMQTIKGELTGPVFEPMRFVINMKDDGRKNALEIELSCGGSKPWVSKFEIGAVEQQQQERRGELAQQQSTYKTYARVLLPQRSQPIEMLGLVSVSYKPNTIVSYDIKVPQELIEMFTSKYNRKQQQVVGDRQTIKGRLTINNHSNNNMNRATGGRISAARDLKSVSQQFMRMLTQDGELNISNDVDIKLASFSYKCLTHFGVKPQDQHIVLSHNVDYLSSNNKMEQYRFDLELQNKHYGKQQQQGVEQLFLVQQFNTKYPTFDRVFKLENKNVLKKQSSSSSNKKAEREQLFTMKYLYPTENYVQQVRYLIKSGDKMQSMQQRQNLMSAIEYGHKFQYVTLKDMQVVMRLVVSPIKINREVTFQIQSQKQQQQQQQQQQHTQRQQQQQSIMRLISEQDSIKALVVVKDMRKNGNEREDLNAVIKIDQYFETRGQFNVLVKAEFLNKKHTIELRHDMQRQQQDSYKNLFRFALDKQEPTVFDYTIRPNYQQQQSSKLVDYLIEGTLKDERSERPVPVRATTQLSYVNGIEFVQTIDIPEREIKMNLLVSEQQEVFKFIMDTRTIKAKFVTDIKQENKQEMLVMISYLPKRFQHQSRIVFDQERQTLFVESQQNNEGRPEYKLQSELYSPIDLNVFAQQYQTMFSGRRQHHQQQKRSPTVKRSIVQFRQNQQASYVRCEYGQDASLFQMEYKPVEDKFLVVFKDNKHQIYHKTLVELSSAVGAGQRKLSSSSSSSMLAMFIVQSQTMKYNNVLYTVDFQVPIFTSIKSFERCEQPAKLRIVVPRFYNVQMELEPIKMTFTTLLKKGEKFERTLELINQRSSSSANNQYVYPTFVRDVVYFMNEKISEAKFMLDAQSYPQIKLAMEVNESNSNKKLYTLGADIWMDQQQVSTLAWKLADNFSSETRWQLVKGMRQSAGQTLKINSQMKDLVKGERYLVDATLSCQDKSHVTIDTPFYSSEMDYEPMEQRAHLTTMGGKNTDRAWQLESSFDRSPISGSNDYSRRVQTSYKNKREQQKHNFEYNPRDESLKFFSERQPATDLIKKQNSNNKHYWSVDGNVNSYGLFAPKYRSSASNYGRKPAANSTNKQQQEQESFVNFKHNDDFEGSFAMRPFAYQPEEEQYVKMSMKSRGNQQMMPAFETESRFLAKRDTTSGQSRYDVFMKHMSRDQLVALLDITLEKKQKLQKQVQQLTGASATNQKVDNDDVDDDDEDNLERSARVHLKSDKHGHATWEHKWNKQQHQMPREDSLKFDLDLNKKYNDFKHKTDITFQRPPTSIFDEYDQEDKNGEFIYDVDKHQERRNNYKRTATKKINKRSATSVKKINSMLKRSTRFIRSANINMRSSTEYNKRDLYNVEADYNQLYNRQQAKLNKHFVAKPNSFKLTAFEYQTELEYQPKSHAQLKMTTPQQVRHYTRYETPSEQVRKLSSRTLNKRGEELYSINAQLPTSMLGGSYKVDVDGETISCRKYPQKCEQYYSKRVHKRSVANNLAGSVPTQFQYQDYQGRKMALDMDMERHSNQQYFDMSIEDAKSGYQHSTKYTNGQQEHSLKTATRSHNLGPIFIVDIDASKDGKSMKVHFATPVVAGELSGYRAKTGVQSLKLRLQNIPFELQQQQKQQEQQLPQQEQATKEQVKQLKALFGSSSMFNSMLARQFWHETELFVNELEQYYKFRTETLVNRVRLIDLLMETRGNKLSTMKLMTKQSVYEVKLNQEQPRLDVHIDYEHKLFTHDTKIQLLEQSNQWNLQTVTGYQGKQVANLEGTLMRCSQRRPVQFDCKSQISGQLLNEQYTLYVQFDHLKELIVGRVKDMYRQEDHSFQFQYQSTEQQQFVEQPIIMMDYSVKTFQTQEIIYLGEARLNVYDLPFFGKQQQKQRRTSFGTPMVNELKFVIKPQASALTQTVYVKYMPKGLFELSVDSVPCQFNHLTKIELPAYIRYVQTSQEAIATSTPRLRDLLKQVRAISHQECLSNKCNQDYTNYDLKVNFDEEKLSTVSWKSPISSMKFELSPEDKRIHSRPGQFVVSTRHFDTECEFEFETKSKCFTLTSRTAVKHQNQKPQVYEFDSEFYSSKKQPTNVVFRTPNSQYQMDTQFLSSEPRISFRYDNELDNFRHEMKYQSPDSTYRRHQLRLTRGVRSPKGIMSYKNKPARNMYTIDSNDKSYESFDVNFDRDYKQDSYARYESPLYKANVKYNVQQKLLNAKYNRQNDQFEHETDIQFVQHPTLFSNNKQYFEMPMTITTRSKRAGRSLYNTVYTNKDNKKHTFEHESHSYQLRMTVDPRTNELVTDIVTPENRRQHTEIVFPTRQQQQYSMKSFLKTAQGTEVYSLDASYVKSVKKFQAVYRMFPSQQIIAEWDGQLRRGSIRSQLVTVDIRETECIMFYENPKTKQTYSGRITYDLNKLTTTPIEGKFVRSTGEQLLVKLDTDRKFQVTRVMIKVLNKENIQHFLGQFSLNFETNTFASKMEYDEVKMERFLKEFERRYPAAKGVINTILEVLSQLVVKDQSSSSKPQVSGQTIIVLKDISKLVEQLYEQVHDECTSRHNLRSCLVIKEYFNDYRRNFVRLTNKFQQQVEQFIENVPMVNGLFKKILKKVKQCMVGKQSFDKFIQDYQQHYFGQATPNISTMLTNFVDIVSDPSMYVSHQSFVTSKPGYFNMELSPEIFNPLRVIPMRYQRSIEISY